MSKAKVLIVLGSSSDLPDAEAGMKELESFEIPYSLRIASAHRTPEHLESIMQEFERDGGEVYIAAAGMSAHLAGVVAAFTTKPVLAVPIYRKETAGLDSLLSMGQMPKGIPVATMTIGKHGFVNAAVFSVQMLGMKDEALRSKLTQYRKSMKAKVMEDDKASRRDFGY